MAGSIKTPVRKQWKIPDTSLYKLRYQLAEDGCMESQLEIAKQLLQEECDIRAIREANYRQAIHWLLRSAEQGSEEAVKLLETCHHNGCGVTEENVNDIKTCLNMTQYEKIARKTAREIYSSLSKECDHIRLLDLNEHMLRIHLQKKNPENQQCQKPHICNDFKKVQDILVKESNLLSAAISFANGKVPTITQSLSLNSCSCIFTTKSEVLPKFSLCLINDLIFKFAKTFLTIFSNIYFHMCIFLYLFLYSSHLSLVVPLMVYYLCFVFMTIITFSIFDVHKSFEQFLMWADLFHFHSDGALDSKKAQSVFLKKNTVYQKIFFPLFFLHIVLHHLINKYWILHTEFAVLSLYLSVISLIIYWRSNSQNSCSRVLSASSYLLNGLVKYPYADGSFMNNSWTTFNFDLNNTSAYLFGNKLEFNLNCRALLYTIVPGILIILAKMQNWHGFFIYFLPHCLILSWFQLFVLNAEFITLNGFLRVLIIFILLICFRPTYKKTGLILPCLAFDKWLNVDDIKSRIGIFVIFITIAILFKRYMNPNKSLKSLIHKFKVLMITASILFLTTNFINKTLNIQITNLEIKNDYVSSVNNINKQFLTWEEYQYICLNPSWRKADHITSQIDCLHLNGLHVKWDGYITNIKLNSIQNIWSDIFKIFPDFLNEKLKCLIGNKVKLSCTTDECKSINQKLNREEKCDLETWNRYEHEITVNLQTGILTAGPKIILRANHEFSNFTKTLQINDKINFKGVLEISTLKNSPDENLVINLEEISCLNCYKFRDCDVNPTKSIESSKNYIKYFIISLRNTINFILNPVITVQ